MWASIAAPRSLIRLFLVYAAVSLVPVLLLGALLADYYGQDSRKQGLAQGRSEAALVAETAIEPLLTGHPLSEGLTAGEQTQLQKTATRAVHEQNLIRVRVRDLQGLVVFSDDGSGFTDKPDGEALEAARGVNITRLTHLNSDSNDTGQKGVKVVEVYLLLRAGEPARPVGVLEVYLPYSPIERSVTAGLHALFRDLVFGLTVLWLVLFGVCVGVTGGLRRQVRLSTFLAEHDALTDLPNRTLFRRRIKETLAENDGEAFAVAIVDLDRFKEINDTLGHVVGDRVLIELGRRLDTAMPAPDFVARLGGDEFGLVVHGVCDAQTLTRRLRDAIGRDVEFDDLRLVVEASIGFVVAPEDGADVDQLLQHADVAMYVAKAQQAGPVRYDPAHDHYDAHNLTLIADLRRGIDAGELVLHYQPKTRVLDGRVDSVEALVRWQHPTLGMIPPDRFIPLAEKTDLMERLTTWVLGAALREIRDLGNTADDRLPVAVNVSARSLARPDFAEHVVQTLGRLGVPPQRLVIEITETALLADPGRAAKVLAELAAVGVRVSLDDFGSGQTSLGYLSALTVHELKIDKGFVSNMLERGADDAIVRSIIDLGHNLGLRVVAEGVDTDGILLRLRSAGCDVAQGYLLARPMSITALKAWLATVPAGGAVPAWTEATSYRPGQEAERQLH